MRIVLALATIAAIFVLSPARDGDGPAALAGRAVETARAALPMPLVLQGAAALAARRLEEHRGAVPSGPDKTAPGARHGAPSRL